MSYLVIYNPNASNGVASKRLGAVEKALGDAEISYEMVFTKAQGDAKRLAQEAAFSHEVVVAAGGDGTINEAINGLMNAAGGNYNPKVAALGVVCAGRGNDYAFGASIPRDLTDACAVLKRDSRRRLDVGTIVCDDQADITYFGNGIGIGFDTIVGLEASKISWAQGFLGYLLGALKTMFFYYDPPDLSLRTDNIEETTPLLQISAMIGRRMGGAFYMAPEAVNDDGLFDVCLAGNPKRREMLPIIASFLKGTQAGRRYIRFDRTKSLEVDSPDGKIIMHADGETICTEGSHVAVRIIQGGLEVICDPALQNQSI